MSKAVLEVETILGTLSETKFEKCLKGIKIVSLGEGRCTAELTVTEEHTNTIGGLHGGLSATLIDMVSTWGAYTHKNAYAIKSVSVNINVSYISGAKEGDEILIEADSLKVGKTLIFCEVLIKNKATGNLLVKGEHTKYLLR